jgi:CRISPR-associated endonuclease/helicase Cas3
MKKTPSKSMKQEFNASRILAKSDGKSLLQHIEDCLEVYRGLTLALPIIPSLVGLHDFFDLLFCAVYLHDWGKAHVEFQKVLKKKKNQWRHNRHEIFSVPFVEMLPFSPDHKKLIAQSILAHHKDFETLLDYLYSEEQVEEYRRNLSSGINPIDFKDNLLQGLKVDYLLELKSHLQSHYDRYAPGNRHFDFRNIDFSSEQNPIRSIAMSYLNENSQSDDKRYWQQMLLSGATKLCDHMGSAEIGEIPRLTENNFDFLARLNNKWYAHQEKCGQVKGNLFLMAPTGSGKTEAALLWVKKQLQGGHQGRIFYVLPYTASINAMHQRLIGDFEDKGTKPGRTKYIGILHGKLSQYLAEYFEDVENDVSEQKTRLLRIKNMHRQMVHPLKVVTPFQILKYCYGVKGFDMGFTELAGAMLIFDEIHAYDTQTFAQIVASLKWMAKHLQVRVMIMTATLPSFMLNELRVCVDPAQVVKAEQTLLEQFTRHRVEIVDGTIVDQVPLIKESLRKGQRVIVVCNTVSNAQEMFRQINGKTKNQESILLHSRFIAKDRMKKERHLIEEEINVSLLVGTQAIEVSLDIDFDVMFTEPAPLDALIQRFGRINRKRKKGICPVYVCEIGGEYDRYIYPENAVQETLRVLKSVFVMQENAFQKMLDRVYPDWPEKDKYEEIKVGFAMSLSRLKPFMQHKENEKAFYEKFTGVSVLPSCFQGDYEESLHGCDFIKADQLTITVHRGMFYRLLNEGLIERSSAVVQRGDRLRSFPYWIVNCRYDRQFGLLEKDTWVESSTTSL